MYYSGRRRREFKSMRELLDEMDELMEHMIDRFFWEHPGWNMAEACLEPLFNVFVTTENVNVLVDMPFADAESIDLKRVDEETILLTAKLRKRICFRDLGMDCQTGTFSTYKTEISVPKDIDLERAELDNRGNILLIAIPRKKVKQLTGKDIE